MIFKIVYKLILVQKKYFNRIKYFFNYFQPKKFVINILNLSILSFII